MTLVGFVSTDINSGRSIFSYTLLNGIAYCRFKQIPVILNVWGKTKFVIPISMG